jgi:4-alpha-glucanotransferase
MRVLWFERAADHGFIGAQDYEPLSTAMSGTHDTVTVAGWWRGRDLDWAEQLGRLPDGTGRAEAEAIREWDRGLLWSTLNHEAPRPAPDDLTPVVDAAIAHIARTPACLALISLEDMLGLEEQPNLPGTVAVHPNWCRRMAAPTAQLLESPDARRRCAILDLARHGSAPPQ